MPLSRRQHQPCENMRNHGKRRDPGQQASLVEADIVLFLLDREVAGADRRSRHAAPDVVAANIGIGGNVPAVGAQYFNELVGVPFLRFDNMREGHGAGKALKHGKIEGPRAILVIERFEHGGMGLRAERRADLDRDGEIASMRRAVLATTAIAATAPASFRRFISLELHLVLLMENEHIRIRNKPLRRPYGLPNRRRGNYRSHD